MDDQPDNKGGFLKVIHNGTEDAMFVALLNERGVALEAATSLLHDSQNPSADGTRGIISTLQTDTPSTQPNQNNTLFNALWENEYVPNYGMIYASQSPGNALLIQKYQSESFDPDDDETQIRIMENDLSRSRFEVYNNGKTLLSSKNDLTGAGHYDSPPLVLRGTYYSGGNADLQVQLQNVLNNDGDYRLSVQDDSGVEKAAVTNDGQLWVKAHSGYADSQSIRTTAATNTTDSSDTAIASITLDDQRAYSILVRLVARRVDGATTDRAFFYSAVLAYREGGGATIQGSIERELITPIRSTNATNWDLKFTTSGNNLLIQVKGDMSMTVYWVCTIEYQSVKTNS